MILGIDVCAGPMLMISQTGGVYIRAVARN